MPDYLVRGGAVYRLVTDHLGSVRAVVDTATGAVAQWTSYDAWGNVLADSGAGFQPFGFAGGLTDGATGLVRFGARDYDPAVGRWTAKDPVGFGGGLGGLYTYSNGDAVNYIDSGGRNPLAIGFGIAGALFGGVVNAASFYAAGASASQIAGAFVTGAIGGGVSGVAVGFGVPPWAAGALGASITSVGNATVRDGVSGAIEQLRTSTGLRDLGTNAALGAVGGLAGGLLGRSLDGLVPGSMYRPEFFERLIGLLTGNAYRAYKNAFRDLIAFCLGIQRQFQ